MSQKFDLRRATIDDLANWDDYVDRHPEGSPYHRFGFSAAIEASYGHESCHMIAESGGHVVGVMPLVVMRLPWFARKPVSLPFCDLGGPLGESEEIRAALRAGAADEMGLELARVEFRQSLDDAATRSADLAGRKVRMLMPLPQKSAELYASFKSKLRSQINKAKKNGLVASLGHPHRNPCLLTHFYAVFSANMRHLGSPVHSSEWFDSIGDSYADNCLCCIVYAGELPVAGGILLISGKQAAVPWASTAREFNRLSPNMLLYWSMLAYSCDRGITEFDFGRSDFGGGTYQFKSQWGARPRLLNWYRGDRPGKTPETPPARLALLPRRVVETAWRYLPLGLTLKLGPRIRKYVSL